MHNLLLLFSTDEKAFCSEQRVRSALSLAVNGSKKKLAIVCYLFYLGDDSEKEAVTRNGSWRREADLDGSRGRGSQTCLVLDSSYTY